MRANIHQIEFKTDVGICIEASRDYNRSHRRRGMCTKTIKDTHNMKHKFIMTLINNSSRIFGGILFMC